MSNVIEFSFPEPVKQSRNRHEAAAAIQRDAAALPTSGPIADLVAAAGVALAEALATGRIVREAEPDLHSFGKEAFRLTGSVRGMIAVCWKAAGLDPRRAEQRRDMLDKAWHGIGDARGVWMA